MTLLELFEKGRLAVPLFPPRFTSAPVVVEHRLTTGQRFRFECMDVEWDAERGVVVIITNGDAQ